MGESLEFTSGESSVDVSCADVLLCVGKHQAASQYCARIYDLKLERLCCAQCIALGIGTFPSQHNLSWLHIEFGT